VKGAYKIMVDFRNFLFSRFEFFSRRAKQGTLLALDAAMPVVALFVATVILYNSPLPWDVILRVWPLFPLAVLLGGLASWAFGLPLVKLKAYEASAIAATGYYAAAVAAGLFVLARVPALWLPSTGIVLFGLILFLGSVLMRMALLKALLWVLNAGRPRVRVLIYGAGNTGVQLSMALKSHESITAVAFIDDDPGVQGQRVAGMRVYRGTDLEQVVRNLDIDRVLLAMPSLSPPKQQQILRRLQSLGIDVQALPSFAQLIGTEQLVDNLTPVAPGQFLGRSQLEQALAEHSGVAYRGRSVLVTGAGGSVGSELCRQLLPQRPRRLVLFESSEIALYTIDKELSELCADCEVEIVPVLGTVTDARMTRAVMADHQVEVVFHAAAYKHVPLVEANPIAGLANNVLGTRVVADAAQDAGVQRFILISTDKAVRPTNVMGATKRLAELVVQDLAKRPSATRFSIVRFGNVLGSSGSVIPLFKEQIARGGPVTLTHEDVTRFFMTITEAARLVLLAGSFAEEGSGNGCDVFVLDMGKPVRIRHLAEQMIQAAGYTVRDEFHPEGDIEIAVIGLRPGEKLHEELLIGQGLLTTPHPKILRAEEESLSELAMANALRQLAGAVARGDADSARALLMAHVQPRGDEPGSNAMAGS
jgi:FlaA1/EpsC-like NDP-sugar epimerase